MNDALNKKSLLSIVAPAYNEESVLNEFYSQLLDTVEDLHVEIEIIYVNDGSSDGTLDIMRRQQAQDERVVIIDLSRNFGKEIALTAGLDYSSGDAVIVIDVDLQDPLQLIPEFIALWQKGFDVVYAKRVSRSGESWLKKASAYLFYRLLGRFSDVDVPQDTGDYRLMDRKAVDALLKLREKHRYMKGLFAWIGFSQTSVEFDRDQRFSGQTKWNYWRLFNLAGDGLTSFTITPLRLSTYMGVLSALLSLAYAVFIVSKKFMYGDTVEGYASLVVLITFIGGVQMIALGVIGEYLGRVFNETKNRPLYFVKDVYKSGVQSDQ